MVPSLVRRVVETPAAMAALGAGLASTLAPGSAVLLMGPLGAGKTMLARGIVQAWSGEPDAPSPTYTLAQAYEGDRGLLWHLDLYRLSEVEDLEELGLEEMLSEGACAIEWAERLAGRFAPEGPWLKNRLEVRIVPEGDRRVVEICGYGRLAGALSE